MGRIEKKIIGIILLIIYITFKFLQKNKKIIGYILVIMVLVYALMFGILHNTTTGDGLNLFQLLKNGRII